MGLNSQTQDPVTVSLSFPASRYNVEVKHIKIMTAEGLYRITEKKAFRGLMVRANASLNPAFQNLGRTFSEAPPWDPLSYIQNSPSKRHYGATGFKLIFLIINTEKNNNRKNSSISEHLQSTYRVPKLLQTELHFIRSAHSLSSRFTHAGN